MRLYLILLAVLAACTSPLYAQTTTTATATAKISALDGSLFYQILLGELSARSEEPDTAFAALLDAAHKTNDADLFKRAVQIALQARSGESALQAARDWARAYPQSQQANRFVLQILLGLNRVADTLEPLRKEIALTPPAERRELIWALPGLYSHVRDKSGAAKLVTNALSDALKQSDLKATAWGAIGRLWQAAGDRAAALNAAKKGLAHDPHSEHAALTALMLMDADSPQAEALVKQHLPNARPAFRMAYVKSLLNQRREDEARTQLASIRSDTPDYPDAWLVEGVILVQQRQTDLAEQYLLHYLQLTQPNTNQRFTDEVKRARSQAYMALAQTAEQRKDLSKAQEWLQRVDNPDDVLRAQLRRAALMAQQGQIEEAITHIRSLSERSPADAKLKRSAQVQVLREQKMFERARDTLQSMISQFPDDSDLVYDLAMVYEKLGDLAAMEQQLRQLISARPNDPHAYNALGYSLADRNQRLPEAIELITKALALSPKDPFITDSLGWAHFRNGDLVQALRLLQQAYNDRADAEIGAHLGEVLWRMDEHERAINIFREALQMNPDNETLTETIQRLRVPL